MLNFLDIINFFTDTGELDIQNEISECIFKQYDF